MQVLVNLETLVRDFCHGRFGAVGCGGCQFSVVKRIENVLLYIIVEKKYILDLS